MARRRYGYWHFPKAAPRPKPAAGKARKKFGMTWWGRKWIELVESNGDGNRMSRGRAYARAERVYNIKIGNGRISAEVEGSYGNYRVNMEFTTYDAAQWATIIKSMRKSPEITGTVLNNELPEKVEKICGVSLVPEKFRSQCSCPDWANPCKHIAALYYVLADEIDKAPQILFSLQGLEPQALLAGLSGREFPEEKSARTGKPGRKSPGKKPSKRKKRAKTAGGSKPRRKRKGKG